MKNLKIQVILFDLGGVLVEISGIQKMVKWFDNKFSKEEIWEKWLTSSAVRDFETGKSTPEEFSIALLDEFPLPITANEVVSEFDSWLVRKYPGVDTLLMNLGEKYKTACLSNTNVIHWPKIRDDFGIGNLLHEHFVSHKMGVLKPDKEAFLYALKKLNCPPEAIVFFDDNQMNIRAAREVGINAFRVEGIDQIQDTLNTALAS